MTAIFRPSHVLGCIIVFSLVTASLSTSVHNSSRQQSNGNPLAGRPFYINPAYRRLVSRAVRSAPRSQKRTLRKLLNKPVAIWLASKASTRLNGPGTMKGALADAESKSNSPLVTFVIYNLPNRDCAAAASSGEICCSYFGDGRCNYFDSANNCANGLREYKEQFIDVITTNIRPFCGKVPMAFILEPDSLPNLVTNLGAPSCGNDGTKAAYREGILYAASELKRACSSSSVYLDAAHGGWLGWEENSKGFARELARIGVHRHLRGFAINVSNYQEMGPVCPRIGFCNGGANAGHPCCRETCGLARAYNPGHTVLNYAVSLRAAVEEEIAGFKPRMIIDTSRNGAIGARRSCNNWCNARDARNGPNPSTRTAIPGVVDAYMWIKPPGESDGCTEILPSGGRCGRFDRVCASEDSIGSRAGEPRAPEAGSFFAYQAFKLAS